jgi:hypothetical protein
MAQRLPATRRDMLAGSVALGTLAMQPVLLAAELHAAFQSLRPTH